MKAAGIIVPSAYALCFFPMVVAAWYDIIDHKWRNMSKVSSYYWYMAIALLISFLGTCGYMVFQIMEGDIGEVGSGILALLTSLFLWHKLFRTFSIVHEYEKMKYGPIQVARRTLTRLIPAESGSYDPNRSRGQVIIHQDASSSSHWESKAENLDENAMMDMISSSLFDDDYPRSASAQVKLLRPFGRPKEVSKANSEEMSTAISIYMRLATMSGRADIWTSIRSTHRLITAEKKRVSLGKQLMRLITSGSVGRTPSHASKYIRGKSDRNPIQNLLLNKTFENCVKEEKQESDTGYRNVQNVRDFNSTRENSTEYMNEPDRTSKRSFILQPGEISAKYQVGTRSTSKERKDLEQLGVQMYWIGVEQSNTTISEILNQFPHKLAQGYGKSGEEFILEIAILLILQNSPGGPNELRSISPCRQDKNIAEIETSGHDEETEYVSCAHKSNSWFDAESQTDVFEACASALVHYSGIAKQWLQEYAEKDNIEDKSQECEDTASENESCEKLHEDILKFFKILCQKPLFKHVLVSSESAGRNGKNKLQKTSEDVPARYNLMPISELSIIATHLGRVVHALFDDKVEPSKTQTSNKTDGPKGLRGAMKNRSLSYCGERTVRDAEIVWGLSGLLTQLELTRSDVVDDTLQERIQEWDRMPAFRKKSKKVSIDPEDEEKIDLYKTASDSESSTNIINTTTMRPEDLWKRDNMIERLSMLYERKLDPNKDLMLNTELWLLGFESPTLEEAPSPNNYDIVAAHAEMATFLSHGVVAVMRKIVKKYEKGQRENNPFQVVFPARTHGDPKQIFSKWMDYKLDMQGQRKARRTTYGRAQGRGSKAPFDFSLLKPSRNQ